MKRYFKYIAVFSGALLIWSCKAKPANYITIDGFAEGTSYHIVYNDPKGRDLKENIEDFFDKFDNVLSIYNPNSLLSAINKNETNEAGDEWFERCFDMAMEVSRKTGGKFDATVRTLVSVYGFGGEGGPRVISESQRDSIMEFTGFEKIELRDGKIIKSDPRTELDFNAIAKGYSVDLLAEMLEGFGIKDYMVEVGGEIFCRGVNPKGTQWKVGIDRPADGNYFPGQDLQTIIALSGLGLATSGNYRKFAYNEDGEKVFHTIDPHTGKPASHNLLSATIVAPTCAMADGYATACMVGGLESSIELLGKHPELGGYLIYSDNDNNMRIYATPNIEARIVK